MSRKLNEQDRHAVDLLLDRSPVTDSNGATMPPPATAAPIELSSSIKNVSSLLQLLDLLPEQQPPADLVQRTLQFVNNSDESSDDLMPEESLSDSGTFTL